MSIEDNNWYTYPRMTRRIYSKRKVHYAIGIFQARFYDMIWPALRFFDRQRFKTLNIIHYDQLLMGTFKKTSMPQLSYLYFTRSHSIVKLSPTPNSILKIHGLFIESYFKHDKYNKFISYRYFMYYARVLNSDLFFLFYFRTLLWICFLGLISKCKVSYESDYFFRCGVLRFSSSLVPEPFFKRPCATEGG